MIEGKIDPELADVQWRRNTDATQSLRARGGELEADDSAQASTAAKPAKGLPTRHDTFQEAKIRTEIARAVLYEQEAAENAKKLLSLGDAERAAFTASRILRDTLLAAPPRMAADLLGMNDLVAMEKVIRSELAGALNAFSRALKCEVEAL